MTRAWLPVFCNKLLEIDELREELKKQIAMKITNPSRKGLPYPLPFYEFFYWCTRGSHWIRKEDCTVNNGGRIICPVHHAGVRTKRKYFTRSPKDERKRVEIEEDGE